MMVGGQTEARGTTIMYYHAPFDQNLRMRRQQHLHNIGGGGGGSTTLNWGYQIYLKLINNSSSFNKENHDRDGVWICDLN